MKLVAYIRCSSKRQLDQFSPDAQLDAVKAACAARGAELAKVYEEGRSAKQGNKRPQLEKALSFIESCQADGLIVYKLDRAARSVVDGANILQRLTAAGKHLVSATEPIDTTSTFGDFVCKLFFLMAELERATIRERVISGQQAARARGAALGGQARYGWTVKDGQLLEVPEEQAVLAEMRTLRKQGLGLGAIAEAINARYQTRHGGAWGRTQISRALSGTKSRKWVQSR